LVVYYFGKNETEMKKYLLDNTRSGSFVTNDIGINFSNHHLPFGGIGDSGYGSIKGESGFNQLSLLRACTERPNNSIGDIPVRYHHDKDPKGK